MVTATATCTENMTTTWLTCSPGQRSVQRSDTSDGTRQSRLLSFLGFLGNYRPFCGPQMSVNLLHVCYPDSWFFFCRGILCGQLGLGLGRFKFEQVQEKQADQEEEQLMIALYNRSNKLPRLLEAKVLGKDGSRRKENMGNGKIGLDSSLLFHI